MLKVGLVDLDTSHPENWVPIIRDLGHEVVGVFDGGTVYPEGYAERFADRFGIGCVFESLEGMAAEVDAAVIHSCNWDLHISRAEPFVRAGKGVLIDKPLAGNLNDLLKLAEWDKQGARITGGSSLRWCVEVQDWLSSHKAEEILSVSVGCSVDEYNYGIHAYSMLHGLMGPGVCSVRCLGSHVQRQVELVWKDGRRGVVTIGKTKGYLPMYATVVTETDVTQFQADFSKLYRSLLQECLPYLDGIAPPPLPLSQMMEAEMAAIAAKMSWQQGGRDVLLSDIPLSEPGYDGYRFGTEYRLQKIGG
jgi:hypothetical protein